MVKFLTYIHACGSFSSSSSLASSHATMNRETTIRKIPVWTVRCGAVRYSTVGTVRYGVRGEVR